MFIDIKISLTLIGFIKSGICFGLIYKDGIVNLSTIISNVFGNFHKVIIENIKYLILFCNKNIIFRQDGFFDAYHPYATYFSY